MVIFTGALAKHLSKVFYHFLSNLLELNIIFSLYIISSLYHFFFEQDDPKVHTVVEKLLEVINTPSEAVQRAVSSCLSPLIKSKQVYFTIFYFFFCYVWHLSLLTKKQLLLESALSTKFTFKWADLGYVWSLVGLMGKLKLLKRKQI